MPKITDPAERIVSIAYQIEGLPTGDHPARDLAIMGLGYELARAILDVIDRGSIVSILWPWNDNGHGEPSTTALCERIKTLTSDYPEHTPQLVADALMLAKRVTDYDRES